MYLPVDNNLHIWVTKKTFYYNANNHQVFSSLLTSLDLVVLHSGIKMDLFNFYDLYNMSSIRGCTICILGQYL